MTSAVTTLLARHSLWPWSRKRAMASAGPATGRAPELLQLADDMEGEDPGLAVELRGIAMHEAAAAARLPMAARTGSRAATAVGALWEVLQAAGHRRAEREIARLLRDWDVTRPDLARDLRAAMRRGD